MKICGLNKEEVELRQMMHGTVFVQNHFRNVMEGISELESKIKNEDTTLINNHSEVAEPIEVLCATDALNIQSTERNSPNLPSVGLNSPFNNHSLVMNFAVIE